MQAERLLESCQLGNIVLVFSRAEIHSQQAVGHEERAGQKKKLSENTL